MGLLVARIRDGRIVLVARNFDRVRLSDLAKGHSAFVLSCSLLYSRDSKIVAENSDNASNVFRIFEGERGESGFSPQLLRFSVRKYRLGLSRKLL